MKEKLLGLFKNKMVMIVIATLVVLFVIVFPHTTKIKMASDFNGTYTINKERYFLHRMVETTTENVCTPGTTVRLYTVKYGLDGDIDMMSVENCDSTSKTVHYSGDGYLKEVKQVTFVGDNIRTQTTDYNKNGQVLEVSTVTGPNSITVVNEYDDNDDLVKTTTTNFFVGEEANKKVEEFDKGDLSALTWNDSEKGYSAELTCKKDGTCELKSFDAVEFDISFNTTSGFYEVSANGKTAVTSYAALTQFSLSGLIAESEGIADTLKD